LNWKWLVKAVTSSTLRTKLSAIKSLSSKTNDLERCMVCPNMCMHVCPVFDVERRLTVSPSVKSRLAFLHVDESDSLWRCVPCNACKESCPMDISVNNLLKGTRELICRDDSEPEVVKRAFVSHELQIRSAEKVAESMDNVDGRVLYFPGCKTFQVVEVIIATRRILDLLKIDYAFRNDIVCCGSYLRELGYLDQFKEVAYKLTDFKKYDGIISNCPHCVKTLKDLDFKAVHISQLISRRTRELKVQLEGEVVYHDPCILSRELGIVSEPRTILENLGLKIKEPSYTKTNTYCCGFGGIYPYIDISSATKMAEIRKRELKTESETILTFCPTCKRALECYDVVEIIANNL
jgi:Fe-S oxidoreductase